MKTTRLRAAIVCLLTAPALMLQHGCDNVALHTSSDSPADPAALAKELQGIVKDAAVTAKLLESSKKNFRVRLLRENIRNGFGLADAIHSHPGAQPSHLGDARLAKAKLLYLGAKQQWPGFANDLKAHVEAATTNEVNTEVNAAIQAVWLRWRLVDGDESPVETAKALADFGKQRRQDPASAVLFSDVAKKWLERGQLGQADQLCQAAESLFGATPQVSELRRKIDNELQASARQALADQRDGARLQTIIRALGGRQAGYFVVYSENSKSKSNWVPCDYSVMHGADRVANYVEIAQKNGWTWKLIQAYPDSSQGYKDAMSNCETLKKKNTIVTFY